jgi:hypothetical protein
MQYDNTTVRLCSVIDLELSFTLPSEGELRQAAIKMMIAQDPILTTEMNSRSALCYPIYSRDSEGQLEGARFWADNNTIPPHQLLAERKLFLKQHGARDIQLLSQSHRTIALIVSVPPQQTVAKWLVEHKDKPVEKALYTWTGCKKPFFTTKAVSLYNYFDISYVETQIKGLVRQGTRTIDGQTPQTTVKVSLSQAKGTSPANSDEDVDFTSSASSDSNRRYGSKHSATSAKTVAAGPRGGATKPFSPSTRRGASTSVAVNKPPANRGKARGATNAVPKSGPASPFDDNPHNGRH